MAKRMLADVLWEAANENLQSPTDHCDYTREFHSCCAVSVALGRSWGQRLPHTVETFLRNLGCHPRSSKQLRGVEFRQAQSVRYMWLLLAMHVAEDEGIEVSA